MSRFGTEASFFYQNNGSNWFAGTGIQLDASQMPEYPFEEYRVTDKTTIRNLNGDAYTYQNYTKTGYKFRWSLLDESKVNELKLMCDANPFVLFFTDNFSPWGTFIINGDPRFEEVQFEMYTVEMDLQEL